MLPEQGRGLERKKNRLKVLEEEERRSGLWCDCYIVVIVVDCSPQWNPGATFHSPIARGSPSSFYTTRETYRRRFCIILLAPDIYCASYQT